MPAALSLKRQRQRSGLGHSLFALLRLLPRREIAVLGLILSGGVASSTLLQSVVANHLVERVVQGQGMQVREHVRNFNAILLQAENSVRRYAGLVSYNQADLQEVSDDLASIAQRDADGSWRTPQQRLKGGTEAAVWIPPSVALSQDNKRFFIRTDEITRLFGMGALDALLTNTWALPLTNGEVIFWPSRPDFVASATSKLDYRNTPWVQLTAPASNPKGEPRWTEPSFDPAAGEWLISVVSPFERDGRWAGSVGHDIVVRELTRSLIDHDATPNSADAVPLYVVNSQGVLLAKNKGEPRQGEHIPNNELALLKQATGKGMQLSTLRQGRDYLLFAPVKALKAYAVYRVDGQGIQDLLAEQLLFLQLGGLAVVVVVMGATLTLGLRDAQNRVQRQQLLEQKNRELELEVRERTVQLQNANQQLQDDLNLAGRIQHDLLSSEQQLNEASTDLDLGVVLVPTREVAGDLYDCIRLAGNRHLLCVGDVSGKGMPAALLMSTCLSLVRAYSEVIDSPSAIMRRLNRRLCQNNPSCAFTTLFLASLDSSSGELRYCNAGHNPALVLKGDRTIERLTQVHGPALGVSTEVPYGETRITLLQGETLLAYSDGASEMFNTERQRLGLKGMETFFQKAPLDNSSAALVDAFVQDLHQFAGSEPQHDDITVLAVRRLSKNVDKSLRQPGLVLSLRGADSSVRQLRDAVTTYCQRESIPQRIERHLKVIVDELISNVLLHASPRGGQELQVDLELDKGLDGLILRFCDNGAPFNPLEAEPPDMTLDLQERPIGGLGLHLVRQLAHHLSYTRVQGRNVVVVELKL